jgi:hypothetical protein
MAAKRAALKAALKGEKAPKPAKAPKAPRAPKAEKVARVAPVFPPGTKTSEAIAYYRRANGEVRVAVFQTPAGVELLDLLELAYAAGALRGARSRAGVYKIELADGTWVTTDGLKLMTISHSGMNENAVWVPKEG